MRWAVAWVLLALGGAGCLQDGPGSSLDHQADVECPSSPGLHDLGERRGLFVEPRADEYQAPLTKSRWLSTPDGILAFVTGSEGLEVFRIACDGTPTATGHLLHWEASASNATSWSSPWLLSAMSFNDGNAWLSLQATEVVGASHHHPPTATFPLRGLARYDPSTGSATLLHGMGRAPEGDLVLWWQDAMYLMGTDRVWKQEIGAYAWEDTGMSLPSARGPVRGVVMGAVAYLFGYGQDGGDVVEADLASGRTEVHHDAFPAYAWWDHADAVTDGQSVLLMGVRVGIDAHGRGNAGGILRFDPTNGTIQVNEHRVPAVLVDPRAAWSDGALLVLGRTYDADLQPRTNAWRYVPGAFAPNAPPVAGLEIVSVDPERAGWAGNLTATAAPSSDPDGVIVGYHWRFDGIPDEGQFPETITHWARAPVVEVGLTVYDEVGASSATTMHVEIPCESSSCHDRHA